MKRTALALTLVLALVFSAVAGAISVNLASAQSGTITIKADGSIDPSTAPISTDDCFTYTLTDDIYFNISLNLIWCIRVERLNIVLDGSGHTIQGNGSGRGIEIANVYHTTIRKINDITVKNFNIEGFEIGIAVFGYYWEGNMINGVIIAENNVINNDVGIRFSSYSRYSNNTIIGNRITANNVGIDIGMGADENAINMDGNTITENQIENNKVGMYFEWMYELGYESTPLQMYNTIVNNNFVNNSQNIVNGIVWITPEVANIWDNATVGVGNYWSDYNGTDSNNDDIGDTPYVIDGNNKDNYPLMAPFLIPSEKPEPQQTEQPQPEPFPTTLVIVPIALVAVIGVGLLVYFKKRKR